MTDRYFVSEPITGGVARLIDEEAHHLAHVMRVRAGQEVTLFDGSGPEWQARVTRIGRSDVELELLARREADRELPIELTLAVALPKGDRQRWLIEKAVELGVHRLAPLIAVRGVAQPVDKALARLRRAVIEASKQCGRNRLMEVSPPTGSTAFLAATNAGSLRALADPSGVQTIPALLTSRPRPAVAAWSFAIGPEGGWSAEELAAARLHDWAVIGMGRRILRVETAAIYVAAAAAELTDRNL